MILSATRSSPLGSSYVVYHGDKPLAEVHAGWMRRRGACEISGKLFEFHRQGWWRPTYLLESRNHYHARASGRALSSAFNVECGYRQFVLQRHSLWGQAYDLLENGRPVGRIAPRGAFLRKVIIEIPDDLEEAVAVFLLWLVAIKWQEAG